MVLNSFLSLLNWSLHGILNLSPDIRVRDLCVGQNYAQSVLPAVSQRKLKCGIELKGREMTSLGLG